MKSLEARVSSLEKEIEVTSAPKVYSFPQLASRALLRIDGVPEDEIDRQVGPPSEVVKPGEQTSWEGVLIGCPRIYPDHTWMRDGYLRLSDGAPSLWFVPLHSEVPPGWRSI